MLSPALVLVVAAVRTNPGEKKRVTILITFFIYIRAGRTIYEKRKQLHDFKSEPDPLSVNGESVATIKRTEVTVTTEAAVDPRDTQLGPMGRGKELPSANSAAGAYSVHISAENCGDDMQLPIQGRTIQQTSTIQVAPHRPPNPSGRRNHELNNAAWSYTKCAILFFTAILITWIPSSANRVFSVVHQNETFAPLEYMSAFVLPLQGFWNAVIYAVTSWSACKNLLQEMRSRRSSAVTEITDSRRVGGPNGGGRRGGLIRHPPRSARTFDSESTTELAKSRTGSADSGRLC